MSSSVYLLLRRPVENFLRKRPATTTNDSQWQFIQYKQLYYATASQKASSVQKVTSEIAPKYVKIVNWCDMKMVAVSALTEYEKRQSEDRCGSFRFVDKHVTGR